MRVLTKSRFKLGLECPNKLYYTHKEEEYANTKSNNPFLDALASGGFQVEELARMHYPNGILIEDDTDRKNYNYQDKVNQTNELLNLNEVVIFEAAFMFKNLFIRVDILEKKGNQINLIEVKAKSFKQGTDDVKYNADWKFYLFDVAFQKFVIEKAFPEFKVTPYLMLADKDKSTTVDGLNQMFRISKNSGNRTGIIKMDEQLNKITIENDSILSLIEVSEIITRIQKSEERILPEYEFEDAIELFAKAYEEDRYFDYDLKFNICKKCEFQKDDKKPHLKSGFENCFKRKLNCTEDDFKAPNAFEIGKLHHTKLTLFNDMKLLKLNDITDEQLKPKSKSKPVLNGMSTYDRQLIQKEKSLKGETTPFLLNEALKREMENWKYPLNFIDFEASTVALPFYSGQKPYEKVVFQFSHHVYYKDRIIAHENEYINVNAGDFPNFEFVRELKKALSTNTGTVFQYSPYENSTLNQVKVQLEASNEPDKLELINFIKTLTTPPTDKDYKGELWLPSRKMVDLCEVIKAYYYNPHTKGSNSIKAVLPAIFESSLFIRDKYNKSIQAINLTSKNFNPNHIWLNFENNKVIDPYKSLGKPFDGWDDSFERITEMDEINNGGAALTAYGLTQYTNMSEEERNSLKASLLKYCELDTLAMVMVYEHLKELCDE